jgi:hypothetical protein
MGASYFLVSVCLIVCFSIADSVLYQALTSASRVRRDKAALSSG